jgi:hypothetical protein
MSIRPYPLPPGDVMTQRFVTAIMILACAGIVASGLPLGSVFGAGSGMMGYLNHMLVF